MKTLSDSNFDQAISGPKAVVEFWSPSCPACMTFKPVYEEVASGIPSGITMGAINVDQNTGKAGQYGIEALPTTIFFVNGREAGRLEGGLPKAQFLSEMAKAFGSTPGALVQAGSTPITTYLIGGLVLAGLGYGAYRLLVKK